MNRTATEDGVDSGSAGSAIKGNEAINQLASMEVAKMMGQELTDQHKRLSISKWAQESMGCGVFLERWDTFKGKSDAIFSKGRVGEGAMEGDFPISSEFQMLEGINQQVWKDIIDKGLATRAKIEGVEDPQSLPKQWAEKQIAEIKRLGYELDAGMVECCMQAFTRFFICDIGPAPFSIHAVLESDDAKSNKFVTVSHHCLALAGHWLKHPPYHLSVRELDELIVMALFHDVYYYDDYLHHDERVLDIFGPYLEGKVAKEIVGGHLKLSPDRDMILNKTWKTQMDVLRQEWVQMDWYLSMVNLQKESPLPGLNTQLPFEFFHHFIGRVLTNRGDVIDSKYRREEEAKVQAALEVKAAEDSHPPPAAPLPAAAAP